MFSEVMEGRGWKSISMEMKYALSSFSKVPIVVQGDGEEEAVGQTG